LSVEYSAIYGRLYNEVNFRKSYNVQCTKYQARRVLNSSFKTQHSKLNIQHFVISNLLKQLIALLKTDITRNTSILISGTVLAQVIPLVLQPVLRRYFEPEVFGAYAVYISILAILIMASSLRYEQAVVLPKADKHAANLVFVSLLFSVLFSLLLLVVVLIWNQKLLQFLNLKPAYAVFLYLLPLGVFLSGAYQSLYFWLIRKKAFKGISYNKFVRRAFEGSSQLAFALIKTGNGLLFGDIIGNAANLAVFVRQAINNGLQFSWLSKAKIRYVLRKYAYFPKYNLLPVLMASSSYFLPAIFINKFYGQEAAGYFDLSKMLLSVPLALGGSALASVLLQRYAEKYRERISISKEISLLFFAVSGLAMLEIAIIWWFGVDIFTLFFGEKWAYSGTLSQILVWSYALNFIVSTFSSIFVALQRIKLYSAWQVLYFGGIGMLVFASYLPFETFIQWFVAVEISAYVLVLAASIYVVHGYEKSLKRN